jgi:hypothetical protein
VAGGVGMDHARARVDEEHAGAETVERIGECRHLDRLEIDHLADQHGAAQVRREQPQAPARVVVGNAIAFMAEDHEGGDAGRRSLERG